MFWGLIMEPGKKYSQTVEKAFHISHAALDLDSAQDNPVQLLLGFQNRNYLLCTLNKDKWVQVSLDLNFQVGDKVSFATNGPGYVHLTGYLVPEDYDMSLEEESDEEQEEEEVPELIPVNKKKRKAEDKLEKQQKKSKSETIKLLEEINEDSDDEDDSDVNLTDLLEEEADSEEVEEEEDGNEDDDEEEEDDESEEEQVKEQIPVQKKQKKEKPKQNGIVKNQENQKEDKSPKQEKSKPNQKGEKSPKQGGKSAKRTLQGGVIVEDLKVGEGAVAQLGRQVYVYYEGRLQSNNKMFDATKKGNGFKFRLGKGEVIKGWDIGVLGMKIGGKRRITCPPSMAYGAQGSPPVIPPQSTLVFEVELKNTK